jgi:hypothetical protein
MSWLCWVLSELGFGFGRSLAKIKPDLIFLGKINLDLVRISCDVLVLEFSPSAALNEGVISSW